jgi:phosphohistidine phosphatase
MPELASKTLCLIRHAEALEGAADINRGLTERGNQSLPILQLWLSQRMQPADYVLCSVAVRTRHTYRGVSAALASAAVDYREDLYLAEVETLARILQGLPVHIRHVVLIGHNPGLSHLASWLSGQPVSSLTTSGAVIFQFQGAWTDLYKGAAYLVEHYTP